jgi:predicted nucleic acid-binding Zn ribbon protein
MRKNEQSLGEVITKLLDNYKLTNKLNEFSLIQSWEKIVGKMIAGRTKNIYIKEQKLFAEIESSVIRNELHLSKTNLIKQLNQEVGKEVITDIIFK